MFDVMHCEIFFAINVKKTILSKKDTKKMQQVLEDLGVYDFLWLKLYHTKVGETIMPTTPCKVMHIEKQLVISDTMANLKLPIGCALGLKNTL